MPHRRLSLTWRKRGAHHFASHLLRANCDIRTIQGLPGHSHLKATMIYTHTVKNKTIKEPKMPLDLE
jgi:site-specific recombinase XerD